MEPSAWGRANVAVYGAGEDYREVLDRFAERILKDFHCDGLVGDARGEGQAAADGQVIGMSGGGVVSGGIIDPHGFFQRARTGPR